MLIDPHQVAALFVVALAIIAVPGPSVLFVVSRGVSLGRRAALVTVAGNEAGLVVQVTAVAVGLGALVEGSILVYNVIRLVGAVYLVYLGIQAFRHRGALGTALDSTMAGKSMRRIFTEGVVVGVSNRKGFLLFAAILPQFVDPAAGRVWLQMFLLGLVCVAIALVSDSVWALFAGTARLWLGRSRRRLEVIGGAAGLVMIGLGVRLALTGRRD
ncbi:LysE family translocator [Rugosimonospora africana]|uniref:Lysine transporter LysE n=1 Tax=Rugosimonospora africana TaxID=556532 RepID=A0A8J3R048_9ACTN|nr:LysE family translocator [Rugosimonospora africana]GIH20073.1 lysine transporter LysE [Rugosimonospora africana]